MTQLHDAAGLPLLQRDRFASDWTSPARLTVLAALPGWGKTCWMQQCASWHEEHRPETHLMWPGSRRALLDQLRADRPSPTLLLIDDILRSADDELWPEVLSALAADDQLTVVVAGLDAPALPADLPFAARLIDEHTLAFTPAEVQELARSFDVVDGNPGIGGFAEGMRGQPALVRRKLQRLQSRTGLGVWTTPEVGVETPAVNLVVASPHAASSVTAQLLKLATDFRSFSAEWLLDHAREHLTSELSEQTVQTCFERFRALPFLIDEADDETGAETLAWTSRVWVDLRTDTHFDERFAGIERGLGTLRKHGLIAAQLHPLLELGRLADAEAVVREHYRRFLVYTDGFTAERLGEADPDPRRWPALGLLHAELRVRREGLTNSTREAMHQAFDSLRLSAVADLGGEFSRASLQVLAAASSGARTPAVRLLTHATRLLPAVVASDSARGRDRMRVVGQLFMVYWSALQLDEHGVALDVAQHMDALNDPNDRLYPMEQVCLPSSQDFAGLRSTRGSVPPQPGDLPSHAIAFRHLEDGDDAAALNYMRPVFERSERAPSRSAIDGLALLTRVLSHDSTLHADDVVHSMHRTMDFWTTCSPSTFVAFSAVVASAALGEPDLADEILELVVDEDDVFTDAARTIRAQWRGDFTGALEASSRNFDPELPRFAMLARVLDAASCRRLQGDGEAQRALLTTWQEMPHPRLLRFALRLLPNEDARALITLGATLPSDLRDALAASVDDRRPVSWSSRSSQAQSAARLGSI